MSLKVCRLCGESKDLKNILEQGPEMIEKLIKCANVQIYIEDLLPKLICEQCDVNLELSYRLRKQSEATQKRLRRELKMQQDDVEEERVNGENREEHRNDVDFKDQEELEDVKKTNRFQSVPQPNGDIYEEEEFIAIDNDIESRISSGAVLVEDESNESFKVFGSRNDGTPSISEQPPIALKINNGAGPLNELLDKTEEQIFIDDDDHDDVNGDNIIEKDFINETSQDEAVVENLSIDLVTSSDYTSDEYSTLQSITKYNYTSYTCLTCQQQFSTKAEYGKHIKQHGTQRFQCIQCCKFFPTRFRLGRHEETHMEVPLQQCAYCQRGYRSLYNLERHVQSTHTSSKKFFCEICHLSFSRVDVLKRHMLLHSDKNNYACTICSQSFKIKDYLYSHRKTHHHAESCENHNIRTKTRSKRDEKTNKYHCGNCGKEFKSSSSYKYHLLIHTNERPHECETCLKKFRTIAALMTHQRIHSDYRPYQCDICLKSFKQTSHLKEHKLLHLDAKPEHICSLCHASFLKKGNLNAHMRTHTKEKPFKCAACSSAFAFMYLLKRHANLVHGRIVDDCDDTTSENLNLSDNDNNIDVTKDTEESEQYDYIDTFTEHDFHDGDRDNVEDNQIVYPSSSNLKPTNTRHSLSPVKRVEDNSVVAIDDPVFTQIHTDTSVESDFIENITEEEIHIAEQKVEVFVSEETKFTTFYDMDDMDDMDKPSLFTTFEPTPKKQHQNNLAITFGKQNI